VRADVVTLSADVSGRIVNLAVHDNQHVEKGQLLLEIDPSRYALAVEHGKRAVEVSKASLGQSQATIVASQALLKQRQSEERRRRTLKERSAISGEEWEKASTDVAVAEADLLRNQANLGFAQANVQLASAALAEAEHDLERTRVESPISGYVTNLLTRQGDYATAGGALVALVDSDSFYVSGYFEETKLPRIEEGDRVDIELMSGERFAGTVQSIAFAIADRENLPGGRLLANINPSYTWVKLAQRVPVRIRIDDDYAGKDKLRAGTTATVTVQEHR
jgi:multidrug resistance efflux pump